MCTGRFLQWPLTIARYTPKAMVPPKTLSSLFGPRAPAPGDAVCTVAPGVETCTQEMLDLLPVPALLLRYHAGNFCFEIVNERFRQAGLGRSAGDSPLIAMLGETLRHFCESPDTHFETNWQLGSEVDQRHFRVMFARSLGSVAEGRCLVTLVDQTPELRTQQSLRREMLSDSLTGLPNRAGFSDRLEELVTAKTRAEYAVLVVNLERFSRINACMGALAGDELLISVARRLKGALRGRDVLARIGGDEFCILLKLDDGPVDALQVTKRIRQALGAPFRLSDFEIRVDCAIGVALGSDEIDNPEEMVLHAQFAVKRAKETGRVEVYQTHVFAIAREQFGLETELRRAIEGGQLSLHFQPICDLATGRVVSFEALSRWTNEAGVRLSPAEFIPVAEESGLIVPLGRWAMEEAARTLVDWDKAAGGDCGVRIAVNLSPIQLQRDRVATMVKHVLDTHGLCGSRFTLELTESSIVSDPDRVTQAMRALRDLGTTLAMDDFGTGYSNLAYLQKLPIDLLKIDHSFVRGMLADRDKVAIVRAILSLAQALGMKTTAEGIETPELAQTLAALGCEYGQGYLFARPLPADEAFQLLASRNA